MAAAVAVLIATVVVGGQRIGTARKRAAQPTAAAAVIDPLMIVPTGEPDDWTDKSQVLAEVPGRIRCLVPLPDHHSVRFVWGYPPHAEDVDTRTGKRTPSPLVPDAYAEGCPDLSRDGQRLVYAGHTVDDRAYAFVSMHPDGRDAVPEVPIAEPSMSSDPEWLKDSETIAYDIDDAHVAVFSVATKRSEVVPSTDAPIFSTFHAVIGDRVIVVANLQSYGADVGEFALPRLTQMIHFHLPTDTLDVTSPGRSEYYGSTAYGDQRVILQIEPLKNRGRFVGTVRGQSLRTPVFVEQGAAFLSNVRNESLIFRRGTTEARVPVSSEIGWASRCGDKTIATAGKNGEDRTVWLDSRGRIDDSFADGDGTTTPTCSADGQLIFLATVGPHPGVRRCDRAGCRRIFEGSSESLALSPDDRRLAFLASDNRGHVIRWIASDGLGGGREIAQVDTGCTPTWANERDLWVAVRKGPKVIWTEFDTDSAVPTGRTSLGTRDCTDGVDDPASPNKPAARIESAFRTQLRFLPEKYLPAR